MTPSTGILAEVRRNFRHWISWNWTSAHRSCAATATAAFLGLSKQGPHLCHASTTGREHAILHTVEVASVDGWHEAASNEAEDDAGSKVMFPQPVAKLEILVEHCAEGKWD